MQSKIISIGKSVGEDFDDCMIDKISKIKIQFNKQTIQGIGTYYGNAKVYKSHNLCEYSLSKLYYAVYEDEFTIDPDDYLQSIAGYHDGQNIIGIRFATYNGSVSQLFGQIKGQQFDLSNYGDTFSSMNGSFDRNGLTSLGLQVQPLNVTDLERITNLKAHLAYGFLYPTKYQPVYLQYFNYPPN